MKSNTVTRIFLAVALCLTVVCAGYSQPPRRVYSEVSFYKIKAGHTFEEAFAVEAEFRKIHQAQANDDLILGWYVLSSYMTSNSAKEYDYITIKTFSDFGLMDKSYPDKYFASKARQADLYRRAAEVKDMVQIEIWEQLEEATTTYAATPDQNPYWRLSGIKVKSGQTQYYADRVSQLRAVFQEQVNQGSCASWRFSSVLMPNATEAPYNFTAFVQYPSLKALADDKQETAFSKVMPNITRQQFYNELETAGQINRDELYYLTDFAVKVREQATR